MVRDMNQDDIRVLVVDDSAVIRACYAIGSAPRRTCRWRYGPRRVRRLEKVVALRPDVITLDLQMPGMDGLAVLDAVLNIAPIPVIMVSCADAGRCCGDARCPRSRARSTTWPSRSEIHAKRDSRMSCWRKYARQPVWMCTA